MRVRMNHPAAPLPLDAEDRSTLGAVRPGRGGKPEITADQVQAIVHSTLHETPPGATHWSCRSMARAAGVSRSTVQRIRDAHGLQPHRVTTFKSIPGARVPKNVQIGCKNGMTRSVGADWGPQILRKSLKS